MSSASRLLTTLAPRARALRLVRCRRPLFFALLTKQSVLNILELGRLKLKALRLLGELLV